MKLVSIIGDSISTYEGYNPEGYAVFYNKEMQIGNGLTSVYDTWWAKVNQALRAYLCVNNSYSGSRVTGESFPAASSLQRLSYLHTSEYTPNIILVYIGFNDFGSGMEVTSSRRLLKRKNLMIFEDAYDEMLKRIRCNYVNAKIVCGTLMRTKMVGNAGWIFPELFAGKHFDEYNAVIRKVSRKHNCYLVDLAALNIDYETLDGSHPTKEGHQTIANAWINLLTKTDLCL